MKSRVLWNLTGLWGSMAILILALRAEAGLGNASRVIGAGPATSVAVRNDGTVWVWGHNGYGELGSSLIGSATGVTNPVQISSALTNIIAVANGGGAAPKKTELSAHNLFLASDGFVYSMGANDVGQLGDGTTVNRTSPVRVGNLTSAVAIAAGAYHSLAVKADGTVWGWGVNTHGEIGTGHVSNRVETASKVLNLTSILAVAAGEYHSLALKADGTVWAWGNNDKGQLGNGNTSEEHTPVQVTSLFNIVAIAASGLHSMALRADGTVWGWGENTEGELGMGNNSAPPHHTPVQALGLTGVIGIAAGWDHCLALTSDGWVWAWGENEKGQLGVAGGTRVVPVRTTITGALEIAAGEDHSLAVLRDGSVAAWGRNYFAQLSGAAPILTAGEMVVTPVLVLAMTNVAVPNRMHSLTVASDGSLWSSGYNGFGQLGDGTLAPHSGLKPVLGLPSVKSVATGGGHSLALNNDGSLWSWGYGEFGQLGNGAAATNRSLALPITSAAPASGVAAGASHSLGLKTNGTILAWGDNRYGQLGDGTFTNRSSPVNVTGITSANAVASGWEHSIALLSNGTILTWGCNLSGQLGDGTSNNRSNYVAVSGLTSVAAIAAGGMHSLCLLSNGTVKAWGNNVSGQLGDGTTSNRSTPTSVSGLTNIVAISAGDYFSAAIAIDGSVWAWGGNGGGQLGDATRSYHPSPIIIPTSNPATALRTDGGSLLVTMNDGSVLTLGENICGELGVGTTIGMAQRPPNHLEENFQFTYQPPTRRSIVAAGQWQGLMIKSDLTLWGWGANVAGCLGGSPDHVFPNQIATREPNILGAVSVAAGKAHSLVLKWDGTVLAFGANQVGQLGLGDVVNRSTPTLIASLPYAQGVAAGQDFSIALLTNGTVQSWGNNLLGQLGIGKKTTTPFSTPTNVLSLSGIVAVACGYRHSLALDTQGIVYAWGDNRAGQIGNNSTSDQLTPIPVTNVNGVVAIAAGEDFSLALRTNGILYRWGDNTYGTLGLGNTTDQHVAVTNGSPSSITQIQASGREGYAVDSSNRLWVWGDPRSGGLGLSTNTLQTIPKEIGNLVGKTDLFHGGGVHDLAVGPRAFNEDKDPNSTIGVDGIPCNMVAFDTTGSRWVWGYPAGDITDVSSTDPDWGYQSSTNRATIVAPNAFWRGTSSIADYSSFVIPLDSESGVQWANLGGLATNFFPFLTNSIVAYHYNYANGATNTQTNLTLRISYANPIASFGSRPGGSALYVGQAYRFAAFGGAAVRLNDYPFLSDYLNSLKIEAYSRSNYSLVGTATIPIPNTYLNDGSWQSALTNGLQTSLDAFGLRTIVSTRFYPYAFGVTNSGVMELSHLASDLSTNYIYVVKVKGMNDSGWMCLAGDGAPAWEPMYTLEFQPAMPQNVRFLSQIQFQGAPLPPFYDGKTVQELMTNSWVVTNTIPLTNLSSTNLNESPELRTNELLDAFVTQLKHDPLALARFVQNEIELTDALDYPNAQVTSAKGAVLSLAGVKRGALGTFLERQGSPVEQCALLIYLLRRAGVPAVYAFPTNNGIQMLDVRLSKLLRIQLAGAVNANGSGVNTNTLITVNYPWVAAYLNGKWVHLFPWLKDTEVIEGPNVYDYMPEQYNNATKWVLGYLHNSPDIIKFGDAADPPQILFQKYVEEQLTNNAPGISFDDLGVQCVNRPRALNTWDEFPTPTWVGGTNWVADSLSQLVNNSSFQTWNTNIVPLPVFDTVTVTVTNGATVVLNTGPLRCCDVQDRAFLLYYDRTNSGTTYVRMNLHLAPFSTNASGVASFTNDATIAEEQLISANFNHDYADYVTDVTITNYHTLSDPERIERQMPSAKGDLSAICLNYGRVSKQMLQPLAQNVWNTETLIKQNHLITNSLTVAQYQGPIVYLMGMAYYERVDRFVPVNARLHGRSPVTLMGIGNAKLRAARNNGGSGAIPSGTIEYNQPCVDMQVVEMFSVECPTSKPASGEGIDAAKDNFSILMIADGSAKEHEIMNTFFGQTDAVSTVRLLQLAALRHSTNGALFPDFAVVDQSNGGVPDGIDATIRADVLKVVASSIENLAIVTPGAVSNVTRSYSGSAALIINRAGAYQALISDAGMPLNGGFGESWDNLPTPPLSLGNAWYTSLGVTSDSLYTLATAQPTSSYPQLAPDVFQPLQLLDLRVEMPNLVTTDFSDQLASQGAAYLGLPSVDLSSLFPLVAETSERRGSLGWTGDGLDQTYAAVSDPVHCVTGEFYIDTVDLNLVGPLPLEIRRSYSSMNTADNDFGIGWKLGFTPYMSVATNANIMYAAEPNGTVLAYEPTATNANLWVPNALRNPGLVNNRREGVGSTANLFLSKIVQTNSLGTTNFYLYSPNGDVRTYVVMDFPNGTNIIDRTRPYLTKWMDNRGNYLTFSFGTISSAADYGYLQRVDSSSGAYIQFSHDIYGHITDAFSNDGREVQYAYDDYGDLNTVTLADASQVQYEYIHSTQAVTNKLSGKRTSITQQPYSMHLISLEEKPDGRTLANVYDDQRRVVTQSSTVGNDLTLITNAMFTYSNHFVMTNSPTNTISGYTLIADAFGKLTRYDYTNSRITKITDPLQQVTQQIWYDDNTGQPGSYQRSIWKSIDKRGLTNEFRYDSFGNLTNIITSGTNLFGTAGGVQYATNRAFYDTNNLPWLMVDALGDSNQITYDATFKFLPKEVVTFKGGQAIVTNELFYGSTSNVLTLGNLLWTNLAYGLSTMSVRAFNSADASTNQWFYDGSGFVTNTVSFVSRTAPAITNALFYNGRNELYERIDPAGHTFRFDYDGLGRQISQEAFEPGQTIPLTWEFRYYNHNGDVTWVDGPQFDPEDYVWCDYDGAGRKTAEVHWRSRAKADGSGVEADPDLYSTVSSQWDAFGNLIQQTDPVGNYSVMQYDALGQMTQQVFYAADNIALATNKMTYELGGEVASKTNSLGGYSFTLYTQTGKPYFRRNEDGSTNGWQYDASGRVIKEIQPNASYWETIYDDAHLTRARNFKDSGGTLLASTTNIFDRKGNSLTNITAEGGVFFTLYDQLDRSIVSGGPPTISGLSTQQVTYTYYDTAGVYRTNQDSLGKQTITRFDVAQRPVLTEVHDLLNSGALVFSQTTDYSSNHHAITVTIGSGSGAISNRVFLDAFQQTVLSQTFPVAGVTNFSISTFDAAKRLVQKQDELGRTTILSYDGLNRVVSKELPDGASIQSTYNGEGGLVSLAMPGGLTWWGYYSSANQLLGEKLTNTTSWLNRQMTNVFYTSGALAGLPQTRIDLGQGVTNTFVYDAFRRVATNSLSGSLPEHTLITAIQYDRRSLPTNYVQTSGVNPSTSISRLFDAYGQLTNELVILGGATVSSFTQKWSAAGRRAALQAPTAEYDFGYRVDNSMSSVTALGNIYNFSYGNNGLLTTRSNSWRTVVVNSRDARGRITQQTATVGTTNSFIETLGWLADSSLGSYSATRAGTGAWNESRYFGYNSRNQLTNESLGVTSASSATNTYAFDGNGLGFLTSAQWSGTLTNGWHASLTDPLAQVTGEYWNEYGLTIRANGSATNATSVSATLDGSSLSGLVSSSGRWYADLSLSPGSHTLAASGFYSSGQVYSRTTNTFKVLGTNGVTDYYDLAGNVTNRVFTNGVSQVFAWDGARRLVSITQRDASNSGYNWAAIYDALGRRLRTLMTPVVSNYVNSVMTQTIDSLYDPQAEFQELAVSVNGKRTWKIFGPDGRGGYGAMNGTGGLEATVPDGTTTTTTVLNDFFGNVLATISGTTVNWSPIRVAGYGPALGYQAPTLSGSVPVAETVVWRTRRIDPTGYYWLGARYYDPVAARFLSPDPAGHSGSMDLYSYGGCDPINRFDADGRFGKQAILDGMPSELGRAPWDLSSSRGEPIQFSGAREDDSLSPGLDSLLDLRHQAFVDEYLTPHLTLDQIVYGLFNTANMLASAPFNAAEGIGEQLDTAWSGSYVNQYGLVRQASAGQRIFAGAMAGFSLVPIDSIAGVALGGLSRVADFAEGASFAERGLEVAAEGTAMRFSRAGGASGDFLIPGEDALQAGLRDPALYGTRLTTTPTFNPTLTDLGVTRGSGLNASVEIGPGAFSSRENLIQTIIHEETHIRLDLRAAQGSQRAIGIQSDLFNLEEPYVESVAQRYWRMYGGR